MYVGNTIRRSPARPARLRPALPVLPAPARRRVTRLGNEVETDRPKRSGRDAATSSADAFYDPPQYQCEYPPPKVGYRYAPGPNYDAPTNCGLVLVPLTIGPGDVSVDVMCAPGYERYGDTCRPVGSNGTPVSVCTAPPDPCDPRQMIARAGYECRPWNACGGHNWVRVAQNAISTVSQAQQVVNQNAAAAESLLNKLQDVPWWQWAAAAAIGWYALKD